jgi:hypothetical protein
MPHITAIIDRAYRKFYICIFLFVVINAEKRRKYGRVNGQTYVHLEYIEYLWTRRKKNSEKNRKRE